MDRRAPPGVSAIAEAESIAAAGSPSPVRTSRSARSADGRPGVRAEHGEVERPLRGIQSADARAGQDTYLVGLQSRQRIVSRSWGVGGTERTDDLSAERQAVAGQRDATTHIPHESNLAVVDAAYPDIDFCLAHAGHAASPDELASRANGRGEHPCARAQISQLDRPVRSDHPSASMTSRRATRWSCRRCRRSRSSGCVCGPAARHDEREQRRDACERRPPQKRPSVIAGDLHGSVSRSTLRTRDDDHTSPAALRRVTP